jgi:ubiquitin carboxyl-terminal hydrolase 34
MIFDKMETSLKPTPFQGIIDSVFMGRNCCVFTCQGCGFKRERLEINYNLSLEVKNIENLEESFDKFIQKEVISDFMCDSCKQKKDVTK